MPIRVGTCSWADKALIACRRFYPRGCSSAEARLRYYASQFPVVEVDSSYYAMPSAANSHLWVGRTPADFVFNIKAFRLLTNHPTAVSALPRDMQLALGLAPTARLYYADVPAEMRSELWRRFREAIAPMQEAGKLGLVHFQFPPWVMRNAAGHAHVRHCVEMMHGHTVSVEFRQVLWLDGKNAASTLAFQRELGVVHTVVDAPQGFSNSVPAVWEATHPRLALVRLHGRNAASWNVKGAVSSSTRFNYVYPPDEIAAVARQVEGFAAPERELHVVFNTNHEDQGPNNARALMRELVTCLRREQALIPNL